MGYRQIRLFVIESEDGLRRDVYASVFGRDTDDPEPAAGDLVRERLITSQLEEVLEMADGTYVVAGVRGTWRRADPAG